MGEFSSGRWIVGLSIYFFAVFILIYSTVGAAEYYGTDIGTVSVYDPGFMSADNLPWAQGGECTGYPYAFCGSLGITDEATCNLFTVYDCVWSNATTLFNLTVLDAKCSGHIGWNSECGNFTASGAPICEFVGCTWSNYTSTGAGQTSGVTNDNFDWSTVKNTIGFMSGFSFDAGIPSGWHFLFSFIFIWLPFFMLTWAVYMAIPFLH